MAQCLLRPIREQYTLVSRCTRAVLMDELNLHEHCVALRRFFLMVRPSCPYPSLRVRALGVAFITHFQGRSCSCLAKAKVPASFMRSYWVLLPSEGETPWVDLLAAAA